MLIFLQTWPWYLVHADFYSAQYVPSARTNYIQECPSLWSTTISIEQHIPEVCQHLCQVIIPNTLQIWDTWKHLETVFIYCACHPCSTLLTWHICQKCILLCQACRHHLIGLWKNLHRLFVGLIFKQLQLPISGLHLAARAGASAFKAALSEAKGNVGG